MTTESAGDLVRRVRAGEPGAWALLVEAYQARLRRLARAILGHEDDAVDACQETFRSALEKLPELDAGDRLDRWLQRILVNRSRDVLRRRAVRRAAPGDLDRMPSRAVAPDDLLSLNEDRARVHRALGALAPDFREVIALHILEGLPIAEVASLLDVTVNAARIRLRRGLMRLRECVREVSP